MPSAKMKFDWRPSGEGNTAALLFLIGTAISERRNKACNSQSAIPARGHGFNVFNVFYGSKDIMATCIRHTLQAVVALHIRAMWFPRAGSILKQIMTKALRKYQNVIKNACGRTHSGKQSLQSGHINAKYTFFPPILRIPGAINSSKISVIRAIGGHEKLFLAWFYIHAFLKIMLPNEGGKQFFKKSDKKVEGRGV